METTPDPLRREINATRPFDLGRMLVETVGREKSAYLVGYDDAEEFDPARKLGGASAVTIERLRAAMLVVRVIGDRHGAGTAKAWLFDRNPALAGRAPGAVIRGGTSDDALPDIVREASAFADSPAVGRTGS